MIRVLSSLLNHLVLLSFIWSSLYAAVAHAEIKTLSSEYGRIQMKMGEMPLLRFNVGASPIRPDNAQQKVDTPFELVLPICTSRPKTQAILDALYRGTALNNISIQDNSIQWNQDGLSFLFKQTGDLYVSVFDESKICKDGMRIFNAHGSVYFEDSLTIDKMHVHAKNMVISKHLITQHLETWIDGNIVNMDALTVAHLFSHKTKSHTDDTRTKFINHNGARINITSMAEQLSIAGSLDVVNCGSCYAPYLKTQSDGYFINETGSLLQIGHGILGHTYVYNKGEVKQFTKDQNSGKMGCLELSSNVQLFVNEASSGTMNVDALVNHSFETVNKGEITVLTLKQIGQHLVNEDGAQFHVKKNAKFSLQTLKNFGSMAFDMEVIGSIKHLETYGSFLLNGSSFLKGDMFKNAGKLKSFNTFRFEGDEFITTDSSDIKAHAGVYLKTIHPIKMNGSFVRYHNPHNSAGVDFNAPLFVNNGKLKLENSHTYFYKKIQNYGEMYIKDMLLKTNVSCKSPVIDIDNYGKFYGQKIGLWGEDFSAFSDIIKMGELCFDVDNGISVYGIDQALINALNNHSTTSEFVLLENSPLTINCTSNSGALVMQNIERVRIKKVFNTASGRLYTKGHIAQNNDRLANLIVDDIHNDGVLVSQEECVLDELSQITKLGNIYSFKGLTLRYIDLGALDQFLLREVSHWDLTSNILRIEAIDFVNNCTLDIPYFTQF